MVDMRRRMLGTTVKEVLDLSSVDQCFAAIAIKIVSIVEVMV